MDRMRACCTPHAVWSGIDRLPVSLPVSYARSIGDDVAAALPPESSTARGAEEVTHDDKLGIR